jgi:hypothetical protein
MKATKNKRSWEKQEIWDLKNGWTATVEHGHHGEFVKRLDSPSGKMWLACNGDPKDGLGADHYNKILEDDRYIDLPEFAIPWRDNNRFKLVRPKFEKAYQ